MTVCFRNPNEEGVFCFFASKHALYILLVIFCSKNNRLFNCNKGHIGVGGEGGGF